jgi:AGCS family alanine or glycine:cation symporter
MQTLKSAIDYLSSLLWDSPEVFPVMVFLLVSTGVFLTFKMRFIQFRRLGHAIKVIMGRYDEPGDQGDVSHFQALSAALSATIGIGNLAGVATAIHYGGPGAVFWLWVTGFIGMATKFVECTLGHKYREIQPDGSVSGGPMYYMKNALSSRWAWLGTVFAVCAFVSSFGSGNAVQAFTMADSFRSDFGIPPWITGLVSATLVGVVIIGGIKRIGSVTSKLVPFMSVMYVLAALVVLGLNIQAVPAAIAEIVSSAFTPRGQIGGFAGSTFIFTLAWGVRRGLFSNEAGQGSAPIAHAAARTHESVREGVVALLEPLVDTVVVCALTGLVIVTMGLWSEKQPESLFLSTGSGVTVLVDGASVQMGGKVNPEDRMTGELVVTGGTVSGGGLVRSHSVMENVHLSHRGTPFDGRIQVKDGGIVGAVAGQGEAMSPHRIRLSGSALLNGSPLTAESYRLGLAPIFPRGNFIVTITVFLFALSTAISWSYYGDRAVLFVFKSMRAVWIYRIAFVIMHFVGAVFSLEVVWGFADVALALMAIPNLVSIVVLSRMVKRDTDDYFRRYS